MSSETAAPATTLVTLPADAGPTDDGILPDLFRTDDVTAVDLLVVTDEVAPDDWLRLVRTLFEERPGSVGIVSLGDRHRSTASASPTASGSSVGAPSQSPGLVTPVADPSYYPEMASAIGAYLNAWHDTGRETVVLFCPVTTLHQALDRMEAIQCWQVLRHQITSSNARGYFFVRPASMDDETVSMLEMTFDDVVQYVDPATLADLGDDA